VTTLAALADIGKGNAGSKLLQQNPAGLH